jgi:hypothetical protein
MTVVAPGPQVVEIGPVPVMDWVALEVVVPEFPVIVTLPPPPPPVAEIVRRPSFPKAACVWEREKVIPEPAMKLNASAEVKEPKFSLPFNETFIVEEKAILFLRGS